MKKSNNNQQAIMKAAARMFGEASEILKKEGEKALSRNKREGTQPIRTELVISSIVLYAFTCEVALKALIKIKGGNIKNTHDLKVLFELLPYETKESIRQQVMQRDHEGGINNFDTLIEDNKKAFEEWRYYYGRGKKQRASISFLKELYKVIESELD